MATTSPLPVRRTRPTADAPRTRAQPAGPAEAGPASAPWTRGDIVHVTARAAAALLMLLAVVILAPVAIDWFNETLLV